MNMGSCQQYQNGSEYSIPSMLLTETLRATNPSLHSSVYEAFHTINESVSRGEISWTNPTLNPQNLQNMAYNLFVRKQGSPSLSALRRATLTVSSPTLPPHMHSVPSHSNLSSSQDKLGKHSRKRPISHTYPHNLDDHRQFQLFAKGKADDLLKSASQQATSLRGHSSELERKYSRDAPIPEDIRPEPILVKALAHITTQAAQKEKVEGHRAAVKYMSEQLKGMRQDLRVQDIQNNFAVKVYEMHARLSLESEDLGEFNQCQAALKHLYMLPTIDRSTCSIAEFFCYRLVYLSLGEQLDSLSTELIHYTNLYLKRKEIKSIVHHIPRKWVHLALQIASACDNGDPFTLASVLNMFSVEMYYLVRIFLLKRRVRWLGTLLTGVRGSVELKRILSALGFLPITHKSQSGEEGRLLWLDLSYEEAEKHIREFFSTIKLDLPEGFALSKILTENEKDGSSKVALQAEHVKEVVDRYIAYLTTRRDAAGNSDNA